MKKQSEKTPSRIVTIKGIDLSGNQKEAVRGVTTEYPYTLHYCDIAASPIPWHWHEEVEFGIILSGTAEVLTADASYILKEGEGYFMNPNILASMRRAPETAGPVVTHTYIFHPVFLAGHFRSIFETKYINPVIHNRNVDFLALRGETEYQRGILKKLRQADVLQKSPDTELQTRSLFSEIWLLLMKEIQNQPPRPVNLKNQDRIQTMLSFIHQHYAEKLSLEDIAASAAVSPRECIRCFQSTIRRSPGEYLNDYRLDAAKKLLAETDLTVTEISLKTGFSSNAYFGRVFREKTGTTPVKYRSYLDKPGSSE